MHKAEKVCYGKIENPYFPIHLDLPEIPEKVYRKRVARLTEKIKQRNLTHVVIYGDREHNANFSYFSGFDLSFEEGLLIIDTQNNVSAILGNECYNLSKYKNIIQKTFLSQSFSLPGQPRAQSDKLKNILAKTGIRTGSNIGIIDWKYFSKEETENPENTFFMPHWIVENIADIAGGRDRLHNVTDILMHSEYGMRTDNEIEQLARYECASSVVSSGISNLLENIKSGMSEIELGFYLNNYGIPLSCHKFIATGEKTKYTLARPSNLRIKTGDPFTVGFGVFGALSCRSGYAATNPEEIEHSSGQQYIEEIVKPFFAAVSNWYETIGIGITGGKIYDIIEECLPQKQFGWFLNPGHLIAEDEWLNSPIFQNSDIKIKNGMALQMDIIPAPENLFHSTNVEDGILIMDESLCKEMQKRFPDIWNSLIRKKQFMRENLGISLKPEVFPVSNIPGILRPFIFEKHKAMMLK
ncbi:MAG: hypothetical protein M1501_01515 [Candidatus Omnitrophica bacterium]|nr:hypothetical protein [Candidatus Omnitrophota bacterium]